MLRTIGEVNSLPSALTRLARSVLTLGLLVLVKESDANTTQKWPDRDLYTPKSQYIYYRVHKWVELYWTSVGKQASEKGNRLILETSFTQPFRVQQFGGC